MLKLQGFDDCIVGVAERCGCEPLLVYDAEKIIDKLCDEMDFETAVEFYEFNIAGGYMGEGSPLLLDRNLDNFEDLDIEQKVNDESEKEI